MCRASSNEESARDCRCSQPWDSCFNRDIFSAINSSHTSRICRNPKVSIYQTQTLSVNKYFNTCTKWLIKHINYKPVMVSLISHEEESRIHNVSNLQKVKFKIFVIRESRNIITKSFALYKYSHHGSWFKKWIPTWDLNLMLANISRR